MHDIEIRTFLRDQKSTKPAALLILAMLIVPAVAVAQDATTATATESKEVARDSWYAGSRTFTASHKDVITSVLLRYRAPVHGRVSIEPAVGVSVAFGSTTHTHVVHYTYDFNYPSCYPLCPHAERDETVSGTSPGFTGSCDVAVSTVAHVTLVFASRFDYFIDRDTVRPSLGLGPMILQLGVGARFGF